MHLKIATPVVFRINRQLMAIECPLPAEDWMNKIVEAITPVHLKKRLDQEREIDFSYFIPGIGRFRTNLFQQRGQWCLAMRYVKTLVPSFQELGLLEQIKGIAESPRGIVLVAGSTGCGKSTTLAAMIEHINASYKKHIITLEDPIEYAFQNNKATIEQREVGNDVPTFEGGLRHVLRQDPDVILVGEMRDLETTSAAITAAETGHLVLSTLHTVNAPQTIERIIDIYPSDQQNQIRSMLANTLQAVISQTLFKRIDQPGMIPGVEIMLCTPAVRNCIRENRIFELPNIIATSRQLGMQTLDDSIKQLYVNGYISREDAVAQAAHPEKLDRALVA